MGENDIRRMDGFICPIKEAEKRIILQDDCRKQNKL